MTRIAIVTPVFNSEILIEDTLKSVLNQEGIQGKEVTYIVCDGASTDKTLEIANSYADKFAGSGINYRVVSEKDRGMYDAIAKGFRLAGNEHDIFAYINAGDYFSPYTFRVIQQLIPGRARWLTGLDVNYNESGYFVRSSIPFIYPRSLIRQGFFGTKLPYIQQESTFWGRELHQKIDFEKFAQYRFAGDYYLWHTFAEHAELDIVECWLGGFRKHHGQLSQQHIDKYFKEFYDIADKRRWYNYLYAFALKFGWKLPGNIRQILNTRIIVIE